MSAACTPAYGTWAALARANAEAAAGWPAPLREMRAQAREALLGADATRLVIATGHQPELFHPGIWVKAFLAARLAAEVNGAGVDVVVDSDAFEALTVRCPVLAPSAGFREHVLAVAEGASCWAMAPPPTGDAVARFGEAVAAELATLPDATPAECFARFRGVLETTRAPSLGEFSAAARRGYDGLAMRTPAISAIACTDAFRAFAASLHGNAAFAAAYNGALADYRARHRTRTAAQPAPDLAAGELPLWQLTPRERRAVHGALPEGPLAPRALALTLFLRLFVADLFVHGTGGGRYDEATDALIARAYEIAPPAYVVATVPLLPLPLGRRADPTRAQTLVRLVEDAARNPERALEGAGLGGAPEAKALVAEKAARLAAGDTRALAPLNAKLAALLAPTRDRWQAELRALRDLETVASHREYPFCFYAPEAMLQLARDAG